MVSCVSFSLNTAKMSCFQRESTSQDMLSESSPGQSLDSASGSYLPTAWEKSSSCTSWIIARAFTSSGRQAPKAPCGPKGIEVAAVVRVQNGLDGHLADLLAHLCLGPPQDVRRRVRQDVLARETSRPRPRQLAAMSFENHLHIIDCLFKELRAGVVNMPFSSKPRLGKPGTMHILQRCRVIVSHGQFVLRLHQEIVAEARVANVVRRRGHQQRVPQSCKQAVSTPSRTSMPEKSSRHD